LPGPLAEPVVPDLEPDVDRLRNPARNVPVAAAGELCALTNSRPSAAVNSSGRIFRTVLTFWVTAMLRTPARLMIAGIHRPAIAMTIDQAVVWSLFQNTST